MVTFTKRDSTNNKDIWKGGENGSVNRDKKGKRENDGKRERREGGSQGALLTVLQTHIVYASFEAQEPLRDS